jgi:plastocyanin
MNKISSRIWRIAAVMAGVAAGMSPRLAGQAAAWYPPLPTAPFSEGTGDGNAVDEPIPGFVGPAGDGVSPYDANGDLIPGSNQTVNTVFVGWATSVVNYAPANRGLIDPTYQTNPDSGNNTPAPIGPPTGNVFEVVSLGDLSPSDIAKGVAPGCITLAFNGCIADGPGYDFAVFGNAFALDGTNLVFSKLAYVEVSSNGVDYVQFPNVDTNPKPSSPAELETETDPDNNNANFTGWPYAVFDPTLTYNLAGKHQNSNGDSWGTPFDLNQLANNPLVLSGNVDLNNIRYVRLVEIPGSGFYKDSLNDPIYDAWLATGSPGFELQAVGVINNATLVPMADWVAPEITSQPANETVTVGQPARFGVAASGAPQPSYHWQMLPEGSATWSYLREGGGYADVNEANFTVENTNTGMTGDEFRCVAINSAGNDTSDAVTLTVNLAPPSMQNFPESSTVEVGQGASFTFSALNATAWEWQVSTDRGGTWGNLTDGGGISGSASATLTVSSVTEAMSGVWYRCVASNTSGSVTSPAAVLTVVSSISFKTEPKSQAVKAGATVTFSAAATGNGPLHYQWLLNGTKIAGATSATLTLKAVKTTAAGNYTVVVSTQSGTDSGTSNVAKLQVAKVAPKITTKPAPATTTVKAGATVTFTVKATGDAPLSYAWQKGTPWKDVANGGKISGANTPTLVLTGVASGTAGSYRVVVANPAGTATSNAVKLVVK